MESYVRNGFEYILLIQQSLLEQHYIETIIYFLKQVKIAKNK